MMDIYMDQWNRKEYRNKLSHLHSTDFQQECRENGGKTIVFATNGDGTTG